MLLARTSWESEHKILLIMYSDVTCRFVKINVKLPAEVDEDASPVFELRNLRGFFFFRIPKEPITSFFQEFLVCE